MEKPYFSIASASRRPQYYPYFYEALSKNSTVPFEIVFVGPNPPTQKMPDNFRHIVSRATPCQCIEMAVRNAVGEYVMSIGDDVMFSDGFLDKLYSYAQKLDRDKVLITSRFWLETLNKFGDDGLMFDGDLPTGFVIGIGPVFRRDIWMKLGGLDRRFHSTFCDIDMQMRFYEYGMQPFVTPDCWINEVNKREGIFQEDGWKNKNHRNCSLLIKHYYPARTLLNSLWITKDGKMSKTRLSPVELFTDVELDC